MTNKLKRTPEHKIDFHQFGVLFSLENALFECYANLFIVSSDFVYRSGCWKENNIKKKQQQQQGAVTSTLNTVECR